jgi:putative protein-disulfide isomerase
MDIKVKGLSFQILGEALNQARAGRLHILDEMQKTIEATWHEIETKLGTRFNYDFWTKCEPRRDTYKACRAVLIAAAHELEERMILAIQRAYYLNAQNPSEIDTLVDLAVELSLNGRTFRGALESEDTEKLFIKL